MKISEQQKLLEKIAGVANKNAAHKSETALFRALNEVLNLLDEAICSQCGRGIKRGGRRHGSALCNACYYDRPDGKGGRA